ncbi:deoxyribonuclease V [candidate division KSB1 bacterium]
MQYSEIHKWDVSPKEAVEIQKRLSDKIVLCPLSGDVNYIAGADISYVKNSDRLYASVLIFEYPSLDLIETGSTVSEPAFPYIPGLLSFREIPPLLDCFKKIEIKPNLIICDGQGYAHPRRFGLACHLGLILNIPTIGCAKSRLTGHGDDPGKRKGSYTVLTDKNEKIGYILRTKNNVKPVYVSSGYLIDLEDAVRYILGCCRGYKLPEPTRRAHLEVNKLRINDKTA